MMNSVTGNECSIEDTKHGLQVKYCFLYSVLMKERWHELNLLKRVNTILVIEGGCTKHVISMLSYSVMYLLWFNLFKLIFFLKYFKSRIFMYFFCFDYIKKMLNRGKVL